MAQAPAVLHRITPSLKVRDLDATIGFYTGLLGFRLTTTWPEESPTFCILDRDRCSLMFHTDDWDEDEGPPAMTGQLHIDVSGVEELHRRLRDRVEILWGPEVYHYGRREFSFRDPDGYRLVLSESTDDPVTCEE